MFIPIIVKTEGSPIEVGLGDNTIDLYLEHADMFVLLLPEQVDLLIHALQTARKEFL